MNIRELLIRIGVTGNENVDRKVKHTDERVESLKNSFNGLGSAITAAFGVLSLAAIGHAADEMQTLEFRVGQVAQSQGTAAEAFDQVAKHATDGRISIEAYTEAYAGIGAATHDLVHSQDDLLNITDTVSKGLQLAGANTQQTTSVMSQLTQAISIQKLQWEDLKVIMQNSDAFAVRLAKSLGMSLSEMIKATQGAGGGIGADKIIEALRAMSSEVDETFKTMPMTVSQAMVVITNRFDMMVNRFNRASGAVTYVANAIVNAFTYVEDAINFVTEAMGGAENTVKILAVALGAAGLVGSIKALQFALGALFSPIGLVIAGLTAAYLIGEDFYTWLKGGPSLIGDWIGPVSEYKDGLDSASQAMTDMKNIAVGLLRALNDLADFFNSGQDTAQEWGDKLGTTSFAPWLKEKAGWLMGDLKKWGSYANEKTNGIFDVPQMWGDSMRGLGEHNASNVQAYQNAQTYQRGYNGTGFDMGSASFSASPVNNITVQIANIDATGTESTEDNVRRAASQGVNDVFNAPVGYNRTLGDSLNFAGGGS